MNEYFRINVSHVPVEDPVAVYEDGVHAVEDGPGFGRGHLGDALALGHDDVFGFTVL